MIYYDDGELSRQEAAASNRHSIRLWVVLSLIISLATMAILSKKHPATLWVYVPALIVPPSIALYFRNRIVLFGPFVYAAALIAMLGAAVLFGT
jgi:polyferredoxin